MNTFVNGINNDPAMPNSEIAKQTVTPNEAHQNFANTLKTAIENVNNAQAESDKKTEALAKGQIDDLHDVMITAQKASVTLETSVEVQRQVIDAYNKIMRMQI
ncbi:flagellar hook-basal body complex protein FliE [Lentibacillus sp. CBA3610]|uniref:flagellar hook-basal body complex protein FliE n=1 Tax=Lentibacillus sp. CBA3610 TaxID=2518176 RepID=UPI0015950242|nr:flagellar hook-basal body complex protein FliE [Lentibacillus sp. CBA3610]QKY69028.1 flagellar hook-basal body complex protein FliE [Lentibacillus sp. CBA3610]